MSWVFIVLLCAREQEFFAEREMSLEQQRARDKQYNELVNFLKDEVGLFMQHVYVMQKFIVVFP